MNHDYDGELKELQDILDSKGITKDQLDLSDYNGCTIGELRYIANNAEKFMNKTSFEDKMEMVYDFKLIKRPEDLSDDAFTKMLAAHPLVKEIDILTWGFSYPTGYLTIYKALQSIDVYDYHCVYVHAMYEYDNRDSSLEIHSTSNFDREISVGSTNYKIYAGLADLLISKRYMDNSVFRDMLLKEYKERYDD